MPDVDPQIDQNRNDISKLTAMMAAQVEINRTNGERHSEMMGVMGKTIDKLDKVSEQVGKMEAMNVRLAAVEALANVAAADARVAGHDARDAKQGMAAITPCATRVTALEEWKTANSDKISQTIDNTTALKLWKDSNSDAIKKTIDDTTALKLWKDTNSDNIERTVTDTAAIVLWQKGLVGEAKGVKGTVRVTWQVILAAAGALAFIVSTALGIATIVHRAPSPVSISTPAVITDAPH